MKGLSFPSSLGGWPAVEDDVTAEGDRRAEEAEVEDGEGQGDARGLGLGSSLAREEEIEVNCKVLPKKVFLQ